MDKTKWLTNAQELADLVRELRVAEAKVQVQKEKLRAFLRRHEFPEQTILAIVTAMHIKEPTK